MTFSWLVLMAVITAEMLVITRPGVGVGGCAPFCGARGEITRATRRTSSCVRLLPSAPGPQRVYPGSAAPGWSPLQSASTDSMMSASAADLSGRCRSTRANRSATPPG